MIVYDYDADGACAASPWSWPCLVPPGQVLYSPKAQRGLRRSCEGRQAIARNGCDLGAVDCGTRDVRPLASPGGGHPVIVFDHHLPRRRYPRRLRGQSPCRYGKGPDLCAQVFFELGWARGHRPVEWIDSGWNSPRHPGGSRALGMLNRLVFPGARDPAAVRKTGPPRAHCRAGSSPRRDRRRTPRHEDYSLP